MKYWRKPLDLAKIKAQRIYDLLGLYDNAAGMITTDTATLHLAAASNIPYVALINNGGAGSIPKGNCVLKVRYSQFQQRQKEIEIAVRNFARQKVLA